MAATTFSIERIDHIKVSVPDRYEAATWYHDVFGLNVLHGPAWDAAAAIPGGPLFLGVEDAIDGTKVALFDGEPLGNHPPIGLTRASFSVAAEPFMRFLERLDEVVLINEEGERVTRGHLVDQWIAWSLYFSDPYGNRYEVLTYEYDAVKRHLQPVSAP